MPQTASENNDEKYKEHMVNFTKYFNVERHV
jgi:hypothetical protein